MRSLLAQRFSLLIRSSCLANTTVPKAGAAFKSLIFIALNPKGPNLPFRGVNEYSDDSLEEDVDSSKSTDSSRTETSLRRNRPTRYVGHYSAQIDVTILVSAGFRE